MSLVDTAVDVAMGTLTETHGDPVVIKYADTNQTIHVRGILNENAILTTMSVSGIPMESTEIQIGFRKSDFASQSVREPTHGDIITVLGKTYKVSRRPTDDGIELTCGLKDVNNVDAPENS